MFELPEYLTLASKSMARWPARRSSREAWRLAHKFVWYNRRADQFAAATQGKGSVRRNEGKMAVHRAGSRLVCYLVNAAAGSSTIPPARSCPRSVTCGWSSPTGHRSPR